MGKRGGIACKPEESDRKRDETRQGKQIQVRPPQVVAATTCGTRMPDHCRQALDSSLKF